MPTSKIKELLEYDAQTGVFTWKVRRAQMRPGTRAGTTTTMKKPNVTKQYRYIRIKRKHYLEHRLAWEFLYGDIPEGKQIDHKNGNSLDNRINNLRLVDQSENNLNRTTKCKSGITGVYKHSQSKGWYAELTYKGRKILKAYYPTRAKAAKARADAYNRLLDGLRCG